MILQNCNYSITLVLYRILHRINTALFVWILLKEPSCSTFCFKSSVFTAGINRFGGARWRTSGYYLLCVLLLASSIPLISLTSSQVLLLSTLCILTVFQPFVGGTNPPKANFAQSSCCLLWQIVTFKDCSSHSLPDSSLLCLWLQAAHTGSLPAERKGIVFLVKGNHTEQEELRRVGTRNEEGA